MGKKKFIQLINASILKYLRFLFRDTDVKHKRIAFNKANDNDYCEQLFSRKRGVSTGWGKGRGTQELKPLKERNNALFLIWGERINTITRPF